MKGIERIFQKVIWDSFLFFLISCILLFPWLFIAHTIEKKADVAVISLPLAFTCVVIDFFFFILQKKPGALRELAVITFYVIVVFAYTILVFNLLLNMMPGMDDFIFYYGCFLSVFFFGTPVYLLMRMMWSFFTMK
ncbi:transporter [Phytobacter ursingii]|uniref:transporter n=1 Tax=Phytobacter ursingii TaxID=1972431 RepID=UPI000CCFF1A6|nr:transporter [Enterobacteriaceae bacterium ENNIH1]